MNTWNRQFWIFDLNQLINRINILYIYIYIENEQVVNRINKIHYSIHEWRFNAKSYLILITRQCFKVQFSPLVTLRPKYSTFGKKFNFNLGSYPPKNFLWASRLWVGRRNKPIISYVTKKDEKKNPGTNGLRTIINIIDFSKETFCWSY